jgi:hypothetical protein
MLAFSQAANYYLPAIALVGIAIFAATSRRVER